MHLKYGMHKLDQLKTWIFLQVQKEGLLDMNWYGLGNGCPMSKNACFETWFTFSNQIKILIVVNSIFSKIVFR